MWEPSTQAEAGSQPHLWSQLSGGSSEQLEGPALGPCSHERFFPMSSAHSKGSDCYSTFLLICPKECPHPVKGQCQLCSRRSP